MRILRYLCVCLLILSVKIWAADSPQVYILCYHTFLNKPSVYTDFSLAELRNQLQEFKNAGFKFVQFKDIQNQKITGKKNLLVIVDDGNVSTYPAYNEVFKPMGIKPVLALYPGIIDTRTFALKWAQIKQMKAEGCEIASHGFFHMYFSEKYFKEHPKEFNDEIFRSKADLEKNLGGKVDMIVYPFGVTSNIAKQKIKEAGYRYAFGLTQKAMHVPAEKNNMLELPRFMMTRSGAKGIINTIIKQGSLGH
jgi:peptidoglycan/xylan/chitin deacetylase (PgdA/CDA1 family)